MKEPKTKILATVGPASDSEEMLEAFVNNGVDAFRLNFSHGTHEYFDAVIEKINAVREKTGRPVSILADLQGPKIRVGEIEGGHVLLKEGNEIEITMEDVVGNEKRISSSYKLLAHDARVGDVILLDDGLLRLEVKEKKNDFLVCKIIEGGILKSHKGMNLPGMKISSPALTEKDKEDLEFALSKGVDFVALSFVRSAEDIHDLKEHLAEAGKTVPIIAKIEKPEAVEHFDAILEECDGIMVARGDLGVEIEPQRVPIIQKKIIAKCNAVGKLVITATQMLESMIENPVPTRAEASDVANAVFDGTDVVMLSGETSVGKHPVETVKMMNSILETAESAGIEREIRFETPKDVTGNLFDSSAKGIADIAEQVQAKAIVVFTHFGRKARVLAKFRPQAPIFAFTDKKQTLYRLNLYRGILPFSIRDFSDEEGAIEYAKYSVNKFVNFGDGDVLLFTAGAPITDKGRKTWIRFEVWRNE
jgi:pyruvate kinase